MIRLEYLQDGQLRAVGLEFQYGGETVPTGKPDGSTRFEPNCTLAHLVADDESEVVLATGAAYLHENDQFDKRVGRKIAFQRAVDTFTGRKTDKKGNTLIEGNKAVRAQLWAAFVKTVRIGPNRLPKEVN